MEYRCETCGKIFDDDYRASKSKKGKKIRFCSRSCANTRVFTEEQNKKKGKSGLKHYNYKGGRKRWKCSGCDCEIGKTKYNLCRKCLGNSKKYRALQSIKAIDRRIREIKSGKIKVYTKCCLYIDKGNKIECDSKLEAAGYIYLLSIGENNIKRVKDSIEYKYDGIKYNYLPDFETENFLVEIKSIVSNFQSKKWRSYKEKIPIKKSALVDRAKSIDKKALWLDRENKELNKIYNLFFNRKKEKEFYISTKALRQIGEAACLIHK